MILAFLLDQVELFQFLQNNNFKININKQISYVNDPKYALHLDSMIMHLNKIAPPLYINSIINKLIIINYKNHKCMCNTKINPNPYKIWFNFKCLHMKLLIIN